jgi:hypothetical protein
VPECENYTEELAVKSALYVAQVLYGRRDRFGNFRWGMLHRMLESEMPNYNFDLVLQIVKSMIDFEQIWYKTLWKKDGTLEDVVLHPTKALYEKFIKEHV